jgi:hypothetical protein
VAAPQLIGSRGRNKQNYNPSIITSMNHWPSFAKYKEKIK